MKKIYFTVGPSQLYPTVNKHLATAIKDDILSMSHRGNAFQDLFVHTTSGLRSLLHIPATHHIFFISSGTEAMDRVIQNTVKNHSYHFVNGAFSKRFYQIASDHGKSPQKIEVPLGESFNWRKISIPENSELICFTHNETSTGVMLPLKELYAIKKKYPKKILALDVVSSIPYVDVDYSQIDIVFFSVQKGFGLPAGLGILVVSPQAAEKSAGSYHSFKELQKYELKMQTPETPNVLDIYLLDKVIGDLLKKGIVEVRSEIEEKSQLLENHIETQTDYSYLPQDKSVRSKTIHVIKIPEGSKSFQEHIKQKGIVVSSGYGELKENHVRIANFPAHTMEDVKKLCSFM